MPLTLTIRNASALENGSPVALVLDRRGALIGRAATADWCLPDPALHISSRHCEIRFADDRYELIDHSTNGTFLNGQTARLETPHTINPGDVFQIGRYEIEARLDDAAAAAAAARNAAAPPPAWQGWEAAAGSGSASEAAAANGPSTGWGAPETAPSAPPPPGWGGAPAPAPGWDAPSATPSPAPSPWHAPPPEATPAPEPSGGWGPAPVADGQWSAAPQDRSDDWGAPPVAVPAPSPAPSGWGAPAPAPPPVASPWNVAQPVPETPPSGWSSPASASPPESGDVWGRFAASNVVDWARGGFGGASPSPAPPMPQQGSVASANFVPPVAQAQTPPLPLAAPDATVRPGPLPGAQASAALDILAAAAGIDKARLTQPESEALAAAGAVLRTLVSGIVVLLEARARAKSQMGAQGTSLEFDGNNPLKFARTPEQALAQLLNPPERGFMPGERAIEDAFKDLQAHQMATLMAMQGALRATLERFSPSAIRARAESKGMLSRILPGARDAALWKAYEREFSGVAHGSDEAFMDMFAKEFRRAYEEVAHKR